MKYTFILFLLFISTVIYAQTSTDVKTFGSISTDEIGGLQANDQQNIFVTGTFSDDMMIDSNQLLINGTVDIFLYKEDGNGQVVWTKTFGSHDYDKVTGLRLYNNTNLYFSGVFEDSIRFDNVNLSENGNAAFVTKLDTSGNVIWAKSFDSNGAFEINEGVTDAQGNYVLTGSFSNVLLFPNMTLTAIGSKDGFVAKYDGNGNFLWAKRFGDQGQTIATGVAINDLDNIYVVGEFNGQVTFGNNTFPVVTNDYDIFLAQYDSNGNAQFGKRIGGTHNELNPKVGIGTLGKVVIAGTFIGSIDFDAQTSFQTSGNNDSDVFLATYTSTGNLLTANRYGSTYSETFNNLMVNNDDYYLSCYFKTILRIGDVSWYSSSGNRVNFVLRASHTNINATPNVISYPTSDRSSSEFVAPYYDTPNSEIVIAGKFKGTGIFLETPHITRIANGSSDIFIAKSSLLPPVSTLSITNDLNIKVFPNPATDFITIELNDLVIDSPVVIEVINTIGQVEKRLNIENQNQIQGQIYHLPKGIYFLRMKVGEKQVVRKIIKN